MAGRQQDVHHDGPTTLVGLTVGPYNLAMWADSILSITAELPCGQMLGAGAFSLAVVDLGVVCGGAARTVLPFAVVFESGDTRAAIGVDQVRHLRLAETPQVLPVPSFGMTMPAFFAGGVQVEGEWLLLIKNASLIEALRCHAV